MIETLLLLCNVLTATTAAAVVDDGAAVGAILQYYIYNTDRIIRSQRQDLLSCACVCCTVLYCVRNAVSALTAIVMAVRFPRGTVAVAPTQHNII